MTAETLRQIIEEIAQEVEGAVGDDEVTEPTDLRDDLAIRSVVVFADAVLASFAAPRQFPNGRIRVQLSEL